MKRSRIWMGLVVIAMGAAVALSLGGCGGIIDEDAKATLYAAIGDTTMTVYPAYVRDGEHVRYDRNAAKAIADFLTQRKLATATISDAEVPLASVWGMNQAKMFRGSATDFGSYVREHPTGTAYALLPEYLLGGTGKVVGVHVYVVDVEGTVAWGTLMNSHHDTFTSVDPQNVDDATSIVIARLGDEFGGDASAAKAGARKKITPGASLTVVPVVLAGDPARNVADVLGLLLERAGHGAIETVDREFRPAKGADLDAVAAAFGEFVKEGEFATEYVVLGNIVGSREAGVAEVWAIIADRHGNIVWTDRQTPSDSDFKRFKACNPMTCCMLLSERLNQPLGLDKLPDDNSNNGKMARLWARKSGTPSDEERSAMEARLKVLRKAGRSATFTIYPAQAGAGVDGECARHLAQLCNDQGLCTCSVSSESPRFEIAGSSNEQKRLWDLARAFRDYVRAHPPGTDYALLAEYTIRPSDQQVWSVHFIVCDRTSEWVIVDFQNNHHADFNAVELKSHADCDGLVARRLAGYTR